ncbi:MAG: ice-binding family protein [Candidatus Kapabacteria bacterium]|nr:ice-binding family protein [Candidatus Kapabacteria bacterium]
MYTVDAAGPAGSVPNATLLSAAKGDLTIAYNDAAGRTPIPTGTFLNPTAGTSQLSGTIAPGLYKFTTATASIPASIILDGGGNPNSVWIFQIAAAFNVANSVVITLQNGASASNIFWQVGTSATIGTTVQFAGTILADQGITIGTGSTVNGRLLAFEASITLDDAVVVTHPGSLPFDFAFSFDNVAPVFTTGPEFTDSLQVTCISVNNWSFPDSPLPTNAVNAPDSVDVEIGFDVFDIGCCGDATPTVNLQVWDPNVDTTGAWVYHATSLTLGSDGYDYTATYTVTSSTPDGDYQFEVILADCNDNETTWTGLPFTVDNTPPDGYQVECAVVEEETVCTEVTEWDAPCLGEGDTLTLCTAIIEEGCGTFNIDSIAIPGENGLGLFFDPIPSNAVITDISGTGTTEDPYILCVTVIVDSTDIEGSYNVGVWGTDPAGNFAFQLDSGKFTIDMTQPVIDEDDLLSCYGDQDTVNFTLTVTDSLGCGPLTVTAIWTFADSTTLGMTLDVTEPFYNFIYPVVLGVTPEGPATLTLTATDGAGNETVVEQFTTFDFTAPALVGEVMWPEDDCLSEGQQFCVTFTVEDLGCGLDFGTQYVDWTSYSISATESSEGGTWEITVCYDISTEESGSYDFWYEISDYAGNGFLIDETSAFSIDNTDPIVTNLMIDDDCVTTTDVVTITFNADDSFTCCAVDSFFDVYVTLTFSDSETASATFVSVVSGSSGGWDYTFNYTVLPADAEGAVMVEAIAEDCAGNEGMDFDGFQIDRTAPVVSGLVVAPNDCVAPGVDLVLTFNAEDIGGCGILDCDAAWAVLTFSNSTTVMVDLVETEGGNCEAVIIEGATAYTATYTVGENDPSGPVTVTVFVQDGAGNTGSQQLPNAVTIDNTAPVVANITVDETCVTATDIVTICFDASDIGCGSFDDANLEVVVWFGEMSWSATYSSDFEGNYCYTITIGDSISFPSGLYDVAVTATDVAGNETTASLEDAFQVVHAPVTADWSVDYNEDCDVTNANPICFDFDFDREVFDFTSEDIYVSYGFEVSSVTGEGSSWTVCVSALSGSGTGTLYMYVSEVYDCAGNEYTAYDISANYDYDAPSGYTATFTNSTGGPIDYINAETCDEIYVTITGGVVGEVADWEITVGLMTYSGSTLITTSPQIVQLGIDQYIDFTGPFAPGNWDVVEEENSMAEFIGNTILLVTSADNEEEALGENDVDVTITIPANGTISFDWYFETYDVGGSGFDPFGYTIDGDFTQLTTNGDYDPQSGSESIPVLAGEVFGFKQRATDTWLGVGITEIDNFMFEGDSELPVVICDDTEGPVDLAVTLTDCAGNTGIDATDEVILDVTAPCLVIDAPSHSNVNFEVSFTWTEDVIDFDVSDLVVTNGTTYDFAGSGADYTVGIAPTTEGLVMIGIYSSGHGITDLAGNPFNPEQEDCYAPAETIYDITPPEFYDIAWNNDNVELTIWWNEDVMGSVDDVVLGDLALTFVQNGGTATGASITAINHTAGDDFAYLTIAVVGTPNGCEVLEFRPTTGASVYDLAANAQVVTDMISINLVNASQATVQASGGFADNVYAVQAQLNWTRGDGDAVIVILFEDTDCEVDPVNGVSYYADSEFGYGDYLTCTTGGSGYVVYYGTGTQVTVDYLTGCTNYRAVVYEVVGGECNNPNYLTPGHSFEFETGPVAEYLFITHINGVEYDYDCDLTLPSAEVFSVTVGLFAEPCDGGVNLVPAYLDYDQDFYLDHYANYGTPLADENWPISQTSKTFTNLQFGLDNECSNIESPLGKDSYYDWWCDALFAELDGGWDYYDDGPLSFLGGEPGQQAYGITFSGTTNSKFDISWLKSGASTATGEGSLLVIKQGSSVNVFPSDGNVYGAEMGVTSVAFPTDGEDIGSGNRALYYQLDCACDEAFTPRAVTVTGLNSNTTYYARVFEFRYDVYFTNYGGFYGDDIPPPNGDQNGGYCEYLQENFKYQEQVVKYRTTTGTGNPRSKKTSSMEGMFAGLELIGFDGRSFESKVELAWATASEGGSLGFEIYRADAETFEFVKIANVAGNVNGGTYKLLDDDSRLEVGKTYVYRLAYIAKDGTIEDLSEIVVPILSMPNSMQSIYVSQVTPNPVTDFGKLQVEMTTEQNLRIEVRNAAGQLVSVLSDQIRGAGVHNFNIDLTNRAQGSYSILISTDYEAIYVPFMYVK